MNTVRWISISACALAQLLLFPCVGHSQSAAVRPWNDAIEARLELAGPNRSEIALAFRDAPADRREGLSFLVENMPESDLKSPAK